MTSPPGTSTKMDQTLYKLTFTTPPAHTTSILAALHATTAGTWPNPPSACPSTSPPTPPKYTHTAFITRGTGQFRPSAHATPHIGTPGAVEFVDEDRVEMVVVGRDVLRHAVKALRDAHPYEVVAFFVVRCLGEDEF
ncbi:hypothetical protein LTR84_003709 [Exophiala bonariae]|uniref:ATP phosphoribosyltransferase n=1 Tax=Exophiala bonariae TaxID=1690606 RepID=A0AAV9NA08_9EURO|nr:hypothetical protein LTR84_003709 [Exophiala bonariae]